MCLKPRGLRLWCALVLDGRPAVAHSVIAGADDEARYPLPPALLKLRLSLRLSLAEKRSLPLRLLPSRLRLPLRVLLSSPADRFVSLAVIVCHESPIAGVDTKGSTAWRAAESLRHDTRTRGAGGFLNTRSLNVPA